MTLLIKKKEGEDFAFINLEVFCDQCYGKKKDQEKGLRFSKSVKLWNLVQRMRPTRKNNFLINKQKTDCLVYPFHHHQHHTGSISIDWWQWIVWCHTTETPVTTKGRFAKISFSIGPWMNYSTKSVPTRESLKEKVSVLQYDITFTS